MAPLQTVQVLLAENNQTDARRLVEMLQSVHGGRFRMRRTRKLSVAKQILRSGGADVAMLDLWLADARGIEIVSEAQQIAPGIPLIVLSGKANDALAAAALQEGAQDFLVKPELSNGQLARALCHAIVRQRLQVRLRSLSLNDHLTGLYNRRGFITMAESRQKLVEREGARSSLIFGDLDDLKHVNDTFGHREGDRALQEIAQVFRECFRASDIIARIGGDEFCALLTYASEKNETAIRERLACLLQERNCRPRRLYRLSLSLGIARIEAPHGIEVGLARADAQLYEHKRRKRLRAGGVTPRKIVGKGQRAALVPQPRPRLGHDAVAAQSRLHLDAPNPPGHPDRSPCATCLTSSSIPLPISLE